MKMKSKILLGFLIPVLLILTVLVVWNIKSPSSAPFRLIARMFFKETESPPEYPGSDVLYAVAAVPFYMGDCPDYIRENIDYFFTFELKKTWGIKVISGSDLDEAMGQLELTFDDIKDTEKAALLGRELDCKVVFFGRLDVDGDRCVLNTWMVEANTGQIFYNEDLLFNSDSDLYETMLNFSVSMRQKFPGAQGLYSVGDTGPAGGIIFYSFYGHFMECGQEIGRLSWHEAKDINKTYSYAGFADWKLPTISELEMIYVRLKLTGRREFFNEWYWSITENIDNYVWAYQMNFFDGKRYRDRYKWYLEYALPIRVFFIKI
jgi:hypothetical protein